ncbi:hypothetical protein [Rhodobacter sp. NSM]|uniref:hypothetical protein n=1 Tax=Rhodobacter sp. NSM TaxID=3457501 RepID=UPI003FCFEA0B
MLQKLDNLAQSLDGITTYVGRLAEDAGAQCRVDTHAAVAAVRQRSLAAALVGAQHGSEGSGDADFL